MQRLSGVGTAIRQKYRPPPMTDAELQAIEGNVRQKQRRRLGGGRRDRQLGVDVSEDEQRQKQWRQYSNIKDGLFVMGMLILFIGSGAAIIVSRSVVENAELATIIHDFNGTNTTGIESTAFQYLSITAYGTPSASIPLALVFILLGRKFMLEAIDSGKKGDDLMCADKANTARMIYVITCTVNAILFSNLGFSFVWSIVKFVNAMQPATEYFFLYNTIAFAVAFLGMCFVLGANIYVVIVSRKVCDVHSPNKRDTTYLTQKDLLRKKSTGTDNWTNLDLPFNSTVNGKPFDPQGETGVPEYSQM